MPSGPNFNNYANVSVITTMAETHGCDAIWPGWGHASENPALPKRCEELGIIFIGPSERAMFLLGDKIARHNVRCWLVNTGWTGGAYGVGERMKIQWTRRLLEEFYRPYNRELYALVGRDLGWDRKAAPRSGRVFGGSAAARARARAG